MESALNLCFVMGPTLRMLQTASLTLRLHMYIVMAHGFTSYISVGPPVDLQEYVKDTSQNMDSKRGGQDSTDAAEKESLPTAV